MPPRLDQLEELLTRVPYGACQADRDPELSSNPSNFEAHAGAGEGAGEVAEAEAAGLGRPTLEQLVQNVQVGVGLHLTHISPCCFFFPAVFLVRGSHEQKRRRVCAWDEDDGDDDDPLVGRRRRVRSGRRSRPTRWRSKSRGVGAL